MALQQRLDSGLAPLLDRDRFAFPAGSVVAVVGPPRAPTDAVLAHAAAARETLYFTTKRDPEWVAETVAASTDGGLGICVERVCHARQKEAVRVHRTDDEVAYERPTRPATGTTQSRSEDRFESLRATLQQRSDIPPGIVIDDFTDYADGTRRCLDLLETVREATEALAWLHVVHPTDDPSHAEAVITAADTVCTIDGEDGDVRLKVPRRRGDSPIITPQPMSF
ncbi:hypothetical protein [Halosegnis sp.]|uniref:hypothetical protein n=1 Tax=Halosegnis sp. TaxID=2864959 RepID=UPI0035D47022